jgi:DNA polymerase elongation subunit (family B)
MLSASNAVNPTPVTGWILDLYPSSSGQMTVWIIAKGGERMRLVDEFTPTVYISGNREDLERLFPQRFTSRMVTSFNLVSKYASPLDSEKSKVLEVTLNDCRSIPSFTQRILEIGRYLRYQVHNCDVHSTQAYLYTRGIFPLAYVEIDVEKYKVNYRLLDSVESVDYPIPPLRIMNMHVDIAKRGKVANVDDPLEKITVSQNGKRITIDRDDEKAQLLTFIDVVRKLDPDILLTRGGDAHMFPYLARRALHNNILHRLVLSREDIPIVAKQRRGTTFFSYGRTYYRAPMRRLYGRVHIDERNTFILRDCGLEGLVEIARTCRVPLHRASRSSIGSSMSSLQFCQAVHDDVLIPRNKQIPEAFKSAYELLVGDRGGFVYEPKMGIHDHVGEVDFSSMYPSLMAQYNISAETILCKCCPGSRLRIPELGYHICEKRVGIVPKVLRLILAKRLRYKRMRNRASDPTLKKMFDRRQGALKWILVTCFGYLGYRNAKFGTVDGHIGVCALGRAAFLNAARIVESEGFTVVHGIVDSLWLRKADATAEEYRRLCRKVGGTLNVPLNFEGCYKWIVFLPSRMHPHSAVLNRYYGVKDDGRMKMRGLEARRRDTPKFIGDAQRDILKALATADDSEAFMGKIPQALAIVRRYREDLLADHVPIGDLMVTKRLSKHPQTYKQRVSQVIAAEQLLREGVDIAAGKSVRFLFTSADNERYERRVRAEELVERGTSPDVRKYLLLLYAAASTILSPFGYSSKDVYHSVSGIKPTKLASRGERSSEQTTDHYSLS